MALETTRVIDYAKFVFLYKSKIKMLSIPLILDVVKLAAALFLAYFVIHLYQKEFRAGVMEEGFRMIAISMVILTAGRLLDIISVIQPDNQIVLISTPVVGTAFALVATYGFYLLYKVWRFDKKEYVVEKVSIAAEASDRKIVAEFV
jgi:RsiW-degrading membrane proteinase PrsW (M82 family)